MSDRTCQTCRRELPVVEYATPDRRRCKGCELYDVTTSNTRGRGAPLQMSRAEIIDLFGHSEDRRCFYCGISEAAYVMLRIPTPSGKPGLRLGLDRLVSSQPYAPGTSSCAASCATD